MNSTDYDHLTHSTHIELHRDSVRLMSILGETLRERTYRGTHAEANATRQAAEWSTRFEVEIVKVGKPFAMKGRK